MTSAAFEPQEILNELNDVSMKMQQLLERKKVLCIMQELKHRLCYEPTEKEADEQELKSIDEKLEMLEARRADLQQQYDKLINRDDLKPAKKVSFSADTLPDSSFSSTSPQIFFVEAPPTYAAPTIIVDPDKLQFEPSKMQCPECMEFITTNTSTHVSSMTWMVCVMMTMMGCVAGCCLAPFCMDAFKNTTHKCPKCNKSITIVKKL